MGIRLIALDIDGTLLDSRWRVPEANRLAIQEAARRGIEVALVTGRRYDFALPVARATLELTLAWRHGAAVIFDRPRANQLMMEALEESDSLRYAYYSRNREFIGFARPLETCLTEEPLQVMFSGTVAEMEAVAGLLRVSPVAARFRLAATKYATRDFAMLDVLPPGCTKGAALAEWAEQQGLERHEVLAIGDNHNDLEMLHFAGTPVVMGNSVPELKSYGWHETRSNDDGGVAAAIERFALGESRPCA